MKKACSDDSAGMWSLYDHPIMVCKKVGSKGHWVVDYCHRHWKYGEFQKDIYHSQQCLTTSYWLAEHGIRGTEYSTRARALDAIEQALIMEPLSWDGKGNKVA